jgi:hypothetical protein
MLTLGGCTGEVDGGRSPEWIEPAWMAETRSQVEQYQADMMNCLAERGVIGIIAPGGPVVVGGVLDESGEAAPGLSEFALAADAECVELVVRPAVWTRDRSQAIFDALLDVYTCLNHQGVDLAIPPSFEVWSDQLLAWSPFREIADQYPQTLRTLMDACPQAGPIIVSVDDQSWLDAGLTPP